MKHILIIASFLIAFASCKKTDSDAPMATTLNIAISYGIDNLPLHFDSLMYHNALGEPYSISKLNYYLSDIRFYKNKQVVFSIDTVTYIDALQKENSIKLTNIEAFSFDSIAYIIGVPQTKNKHGLLAPTYENTAMEWPEMMGGGYHFLKLEGHWHDNGNNPGFTVHLGTNPYLINGGLKTTGMVISNKETTVALQMNINKWFSGANDYSFQTDGAYTMGNATLMQKIMENGKYVFELKP